MSDGDAGDFVYCLRRSAGPNRRRLEHGPGWATVSWQTHAPLLAAEMTSEAFACVAKVYDGLRYGRGSANRDIPDRGSDLHVEFIDRLSSACVRAIVALEPLSGLEHREFLDMIRPDLPTFRTDAAP